ncbi:hypothetical protein HO173_010766 [Letharia columbiana]|uniref:Uncharacterized protein n=1 Tax=Letharia columbiana TaxID=112416 RepID=A0A8H6FM40_9LECA|nr:uncharacterized protein HO173_010766 [Letharia columbiana]KAF6231066.1 hypothetical protein HO173_010766 [Letharia columbiana]
MQRHMANTTSIYQEGIFHPSTSLGMTAMAPPPPPRRGSENQYLGHKLIDDFRLQSNETPIFLPPVHSAETPLLTPLDLLAPLKPLRPGSPLVEMQQNLSAMQNIISQRLLLAKEYGTSLAIEGAFRKAEWERDRARRMGQTRGAGSTGASTHAAKNSPYIDWNPIKMAAKPPADMLPSTTATRPRSRTTIPVMGPTSMTESPLIVHSSLYHPSSIGNMHAAFTNQDPPPAAFDKVALTIQHRVPNPVTGTSDPYHATVSVPSSVSLNELKQAVWAGMQNDSTGSAPQALALRGWIESLVVHWDVDKQVYHHFPPTTELRDESLETMLVCLRDVKGYDWVEVGFETP